LSKVRIGSRKSLLIALIVGFIITMTAASVQSLSIQGSRWLTIDQLSGRVNLIPYGESSRPAEIGDRLSGVGDTLVTGADASARLEVDQRTGYLTVAEKSQLQVQALGITSSGGRITELSVNSGQVRLRVRPLNNPGSRLEIHTPAGVSGVRGTDFGVTVQLDGQTGVATIEGSVASSAQGQTVAVIANTQSIIYPGEPPTEPQPLRDDPSLFIEKLTVLSGSEPGNTMVQVKGYTDEVNLLEVNGDRKNLGREGRFNLVVPLLRAQVGAPVNAQGEQPEQPAGPLRIQAKVITPLGTEQQYELVVP
jgi:hypothetical protein